MKSTFYLLLTILLPFSIFLSGCGKEEANKKDENKLTVYTTVYPLKYFTERIGESFVDVNSIYPPGSDEHTFDPSQKDMIKLVDADLLFYIGLGLEGFIEKAKKTFENGNVQLVPTAEDIALVHDEDNDEHEHAHHDEEEHSHHGHQHSVDPHVWIDPVYAQELALAIKNTLITKMPENEDFFEKNYAKLIVELEEIDESIKEVIQNGKHKQIVVSHAAYGYWEQRYGIEQISVSGLSTTNEPSQKKLMEIISYIEKNNIKYIFFEQNVSSSLTERVQDQVGAKALTLHNLAVLTPKDIENEETYFTIMDKNIKALKIALNE